MTWVIEYYLFGLFRIVCPYKPGSLSKKTVRAGILDDYPSLRWLGSNHESADKLTLSVKMFRLAIYVGGIDLRYRLLLEVLTIYVVYV